MPALRRRFNWQLALVLILATAVLMGTVFVLHRWRRRYLASSALQTGLAAYEAKDWRTAAEDIGRYCAVHRKDVDALLKYADAQLHRQPQVRGNIEQAIAAYRQVLRQEPTHREASVRASQVYIQVGLPGEAELILSRLLLENEEPEARQLLAVALTAQRKFPKAAQELRRIIETFPERVGAYSMLAQLMRQRPEEVPGSPLEQLRIALNKNPESAEAHIALGAYLSRWGQTEETAAQAVEAYNNAAACDITSVMTRVALASGLLDVTDMASAEKQLELADEMDPSVLALWLTWARLVRAKGDREKAAIVAQSALDALGSENYPFLAAAAELFLYAGDEAGARACLAEIAEIDPHAESIPVLEGMLALSRGEAYEAVKHLRKAADGNATPAVLLALAGAYEQASDPAGAIRELRRTVDAYPSLAPARIALAKGLAKTGAWREAAIHSAEGVRLDPQNPDALVTDIYVRANLAMRAGPPPGEQVESIEKELSGLRDRFPRNPRLILLEAQLAGVAGDAERAVELAKVLQESPEGGLEGELLEVRVLWSAGERDGALARMRQIAGARPGEPAAVLQLADLLMRLERRDEGLETIRAAIERASADARRDLEMALAGLYARAGERESAREVLRKTMRASPHDVQSRLLLLNLVESPDDPEAQRAIEELKEIEGPEGFRWRYHQARLWLASQDWQAHRAQSMELLRANIDADPGDTASLLLLGSAHEKTGNMALAIETYRRAYEQSPASAHTLFRLVRTLQQAGDLDEADRLLEKASRRGTAGALSGLLLGQHLRRGRLDDASMTVEEMIDRDPQNTPLRIFLASLKLRQGNMEEAREILDELDAGRPDVIMARAELLLRLGRNPDALALCDSLLADRPSVQTHLFRARVRAAAGELNLAQADYEEITRLQPENVHSWIALSDFLLARRDGIGATLAIDKALAIAQDHPAAAARAVQLYSASADSDVRLRAGALLESALQAHPEDGGLLMLRAQRLINRNSPAALAEARSILDEVARRYPRRVDAWILLARTALAEGLADSALDAVSKGLAVDPSETQRRALMFLKASAEKVRWPSLAVTTLRELWRENQDDLEAGLALARAYRETADTRKAISQLEEMRPLFEDAGLTAVEVALAQAYEAAGRRDEALALVRQTSARVPDDPRALLVEIGMLSRAERIEEARNAVARWRRMHGEDAATLVAAGRMLLGMSETLKASRETDSARVARAQADLASDIARQAVEVAPASLDAKLALATIYQSMGRFQEAEILYRDVLAGRADHPIALNNLAWMLCEHLDEREEALALADAGRAKYPRFADLIDTRGVIYYRMGRLADARGEFEACIDSSFPRTSAAASARFHLARLLANTPEKTRALALLEKCLEPTSRAAGLAADEKTEAENLLRRLKGE